jgi:hypothetical protein
MRFLIRSLLLCGIAFAAAAPAQAQWFAGSVDHVKQVFHNNNAWPKPFVFADRASVAQPFLTMANKGWQQQNLLCNYHFEDDTAKLAPAGELKVQWIVSQANPERRTIYLQRAQRPDLTAARLDFVQQTAARMLPRGELPQIVETNMETPSYSAEVVDNTMVQFNGSAPIPRLPARTGGTASSGSAASGGSGSSGTSGSGS